MTLFAVTLAIVVAGAVVAVWDAGVQSRRWGRRDRVEDARADRLMEDVYWSALRHTEYRRAMVITMRRQSARMDQIITDGLARRFEVVA